MSNRVLEVIINAKDKASAKLKTFNGNVGKSKKAIVAMGVAAAAAAVVVAAAFVKMFNATKEQVKAAITLGDQFDKMSKRIDVSIESLSEWVFIIERAGGNAGTLEIAMKGLITQMKGVADGTKLSVDAFKDLGVETTDASGEMRKAEDVFNDVMAALAGLSSTTEQAAFAQQIFGKSGMRMLPVIRQTSEELETQKELAKSLGLVYSQEFTDGAAALNDALDLLGKTAGGVGRELVAAYGTDAAQLIETFALEVTSLFDEFKTGGVTASDLMMEIAMGLDDISNAIVPVITGLDAIKQLGDVTTALVPGPAMVKGTIDAIKTLGGSTKKEINEASEAVKKFQLLLAGRGEGAEGATTKFVDDLRERRLAIKALREEIEKGGGKDKRDDQDVAPVVTIDPGEIVLWEELVAAEAAAKAELQEIRQLHFDMWAEEEDARLTNIEQLDEIAKANEDRLKAEAEAYEQALAAANAVARIGESTVQAFLRGENTMKAFANAIQNEVINAISAAIAKMLFLRAISTFGNIFGGVKDGGSIPMAHGGAVLRAARGFSVPDGPRGRDSVPVMAMPGEYMLDRSLSQQLRGYLAARESSAMADPATLSSGGGRNLSVSMNIARPIGMLDAMDLAEATETAVKKLAEANL